MSGRDDGKDLAVTVQFRIFSAAAAGSLLDAATLAMQFNTVLNG